MNGPKVNEDVQFHHSHGDKVDANPDIMNNYRTATERKKKETRISLERDQRISRVTSYEDDGLQGSMRSWSQL